MARKTALTSENLAALSAERLVRLVLDEAGRNTAFKKLVTAALAGAQGPKAVAAIVDKRLAGLVRARGFVDWDKRKAFAADLRATLATITDELAAADPSAAADRLICFLTLAKGVFERVDDSSGFIQVIFHDGAYALPEVVARMPEDGRVALVESLIAPFCTDDQGQIDAAVDSTIPLLPAAGLAASDALLTTAAEEKDGSLHGTHDWRRSGRRDWFIRGRQAIADARGDVDAFVTPDRERSGGRHDTMAIADGLLAVGRVSGTVLAYTKDALTLREAKYPAVQYIPRRGVDMTALARSETQTYCPYKGEASYFSIPAGGPRYTMRSEPVRRPTTPSRRSKPISPSTTTV